MDKLIWKDGLVSKNNQVYVKPHAQIWKPEKCKSTSSTYFRIFLGAIITLELLKNIPTKYLKFLLLNLAKNLIQNTNFISVIPSICYSNLGSLMI